MSVAACKSAGVVKPDDSWGSYLKCYSIYRIAICHFHKAEWLEIDASTILFPISISSWIKAFAVLWRGFSLFFRWLIIVIYMRISLYRNFYSPTSFVHNISHLYNHIMEFKQYSESHPGCELGIYRQTNEKQISYCLFIHAVS